MASRFRTYNPQDGEQDLPMGCRLIGPALKPVGDVQQVPVIGRAYATGTPGMYIPGQAQVTWTARGATPNHARQLYGLLVDQLDKATRLYDGNRYLSVLRLAEATTPEEGFALLKYTGSHTYDLTEPRWIDAAGLRWRTPS